MDGNIAKESKQVSRELQTAAKRIRNSSTMDIRTLDRQAIKKQNIRNEFQIVHKIDAGDGTLGGMNGGVFVVRMNGLSNRLFVEKRFKKKDMDMGKKEIEMLERVKHASLTFYTMSFIMQDLSDASLYVEFCDRGSLEELIKAYIKRSDQRPKPNVPEAFAWHALVGLCDGLAYLQTGSSHFRKNFAADPNWTPILHRDIKPDNVLLRSRSRVGSNAYFYCVLSDFGLACEDHPPNDYRCDPWQKSGSKLGTMPYLAPELLYDTFPRNERDSRYFPDGQRHTCKSDLWALGASIFNLCVARPCESGYNHITLKGKPPYLQTHQYWEVKGSRSEALIVPSFYSEQLRRAIIRCTDADPRSRKSPAEMIKILEHLLKESGHQEQGKNSEAIPDWATRVHEYQSKAEKVSQLEQSSKKKPTPAKAYRPPQMQFPPSPNHYSAPIQLQLPPCQYPYRHRR
jgi:NIMA (never in mitosis gene a)-related kinase